MTDIYACDDFAAQSGCICHTSLSPVKRLNTVDCIMEDHAQNMLYFSLVDDGAINFNLILNVVEELVEPIPDEINERQLVIRNRNYYENIIPLYNDVQFKEHFRMSRASFAVS